MFWLCWMSNFTLPVITWFNILIRVLFYILSFQGFFRSEKLHLFFFPSESWVDKNIKKALDIYLWGFSKLKLSKTTSLNFSVKSSTDSLFFEEDYPWEASLILFFPLYLEGAIMAKSALLFDFSSLSSSNFLTIFGLACSIKSQSPAFYFWRTIFFGKFGRKRPPRFG